LLITAVEASTGEFRAFDRNSGVSLVDAVAASCAVPSVWPPVTIDGRRWIDGGTHSLLNADLASGYDQVVLLAPLTFGTRREVAKLAAKAKVALVTPDPAAKRAIGNNILDPAHRAPAAAAGRAQASTAAKSIAAVWS
jgi:NTE family protein